MPSYNGDMMHCRQEHCEKKEQCYRYWLGQHAIGIVSMYRLSAFDNAVECEFFLDIKEW